MRKIATQLDAVINLRDNFSSTLQHIENQAQNFQRTAQNMGRDVWSVGKKFEGAGKTMIKGVTAPILAAGAAAAKTGIDFEKTMSGVEAVTGASGQELEDLESKAREMGKTTTKSSSEAAEAMEYMGLAGWDTKEIMEGIEPILKLSEAGNVDLAKASDLVTDSMSAMGIEAQDLDGYLDVVAQAARSSNTDVDEMMEAYLGVGGVLEGLGVPLEESAVSLGMLANAGIKGSEGGKSLSSVLTNLTAPTGQAQKALDELGFSAFDSEGNFKGLDNVLFELQDELSGMDAEQQNMYKAMIGGKGNIDTINALLNGLDDSYEDLSGSIGEADGALMTMADIMNENTAGSISRLLSALQETALTIYDKLRPGIVKVIEKLEDFVEVINNLSDEQVDSIMYFAKMAAMIGPVLLMVGKLTGGVAEGIFFFSDFAKKINKMGGVLKALTSPGMIVVGVFLALVAAGVLIYKNWDTIVEKANEIFPNLQENLSAVFGHITNIFTGAVELISMAWGLIGPMFVTTWEMIKGTFIAGIEIVGGLIADWLQVLSGIIDFVAGVFTGDWERAWQGVTDIFGGIFSGLENLAKAPLRAVIGLVNGMIKGFNKISLPDWVPGIGGKGINIPLIPQLAKGTKSWGGGIAQVHERGGEIIDLPGRSRVYPHDKSVTMARAQGRKEAGGQTINMNIDNVTVRKESDIDAIAEALARKLAATRMNMA